MDRPCCFVGELKRRALFVQKMSTRFALTRCRSRALHGSFPIYEEASVSDSTSSVPQVPRPKAAGGRLPAVAPVKLKFPSCYHYRFPAPEGIAPNGGLRYR